MNTSPILAADAPSSFSATGNTGIAAPGDTPDFHQMLQQMNASVNSQATPAASTQPDTFPAQSTSTSSLSDMASPSEASNKQSDLSQSSAGNIFLKQDDVTDAEVSSFSSKTTQPSNKTAPTNTKKNEKETSADETSPSKSKPSTDTPLMPLAVPTPIAAQASAIPETAALGTLQTESSLDPKVGLDRFAAFVSYAGSTNTPIKAATSLTSGNGTSDSPISVSATPVTSSTQTAASSSNVAIQATLPTTQDTVATDEDGDFGVTAHSRARKQSSTVSVAPASDSAELAGSDSASNAGPVPSATSSLSQSNFTATAEPTSTSVAPTIQANSVVQSAAPELIASLISGQVPRARAMPVATSNTTAQSRAKSPSATHVEASAPPSTPAAVSDTATPTRTAQQSVNPQLAVSQATFVTSNAASSRTVTRSNATSSTVRAGSRFKQHSATQSDAPSSLSDKSASAASEHNSAVGSITALNTTPSQSTALQQTATADVAHAPQSTAQPSAQVAAAVLAQSTPQTSAHAAPSVQHEMQPNPIPDPPRMVDSGHLRVGQNSSELKISVQLPEVGKVEVRAVTSHDVTTAHITALRHDALPALSAERANLEQALKSRDVILGSLNSNSQGQSDGQQRQQNSQSSARPFGGTSSNATAVTTSTTAEASTTGILPDYSSISVRA